jgi:hypothetical protein
MEPIPRDFITVNMEEFLQAVTMRNNGYPCLAAVRTDKTIHSVDAAREAVNTWASSELFRHMMNQARASNYQWPAPPSAVQLTLQRMKASDFARRLWWMIQETFDWYGHGTVPKVARRLMLGFLVDLFGKDAWDAAPAHNLPQPAAQVDADWFIFGLDVEEVDAILPHYYDGCGGAGEFNSDSATILCHNDVLYVLLTTGGD